MFFESKREDTRFSSEWKRELPEFSLLLICSWTEFWFVTVVLKYLNCDTFLKYLFANFMSQFWPAFWSWDTKMYLVFSTFAFRPPYLLASIKVFVFFFITSSLFWLLVTANIAPRSPTLVTPTMEAIRSSETSVVTGTIRRYHPRWRHSSWR
jgi:hypothetical protein